MAARSSSRSPIERVAHRSGGRWIEPRLLEPAAEGGYDHANHEADSSANGACPVWWCARGVGRAYAVITLMGIDRSWAPAVMVTVHAVQPVDDPPVPLRGSSANSRWALARLPPPGRGSASSPYRSGPNVLPACDTG